MAKKADLLREQLPLRLRSLRAERGVSQFEAAHGIGLSLTFYHRLERGSENPSLKNLEAVATYFNTSVSELTK